MLNIKADLLMRLVTVYICVAADLCHHIYSLFHYSEVSSEGWLLLALCFIVHRQPVVSGEFQLYLIVRKGELIVRIRQGSIDGYICVFYRIVVETIQIFRFGDIGGSPIGIAMGKNILIAMVIMREKETSTVSSLPRHMMAGAV